MADTTNRKSTIKQSSKSKSNPMIPNDIAMGTIVTTAEAGAEDSQIQINKLSARLDREIERQRGDQRNIFIGVLFAVVLIVVAVAVEVIIFNATFKDDLTASQQQEHQDYKNLRDSIDQDQNSMEQQLLNLKLNQQ